jgi:hypothetical protein
MNEVAFVSSKLWQAPYHRGLLGLEALGSLIPVRRRTTSAPAKSVVLRGIGIYVTDIEEERIAT